MRTIGTPCQTDNTLPFKSTFKVEKKKIALIFFLLQIFLFPFSYGLIAATESGRDREEEEKNEIIKIKIKVLYDMVVYW